MWSHVASWAVWIGGVVILAVLGWMLGIGVVVLGNRILP